MSVSLKKKIAAAALAVGAGGGIAAAMPGGTAVAYYSPPLFVDIVVDNPGHLVAKGAGVEVPVEVTCNPGATAYVNLTITQSINGKVARGVGYGTVGCTGSHQKVLLTAVAQGNKAFRTGKALAVGDVSTCIPEGCGGETDQRTITIKK